jgi:hypothetical protein
MGEPRVGCVVERDDEGRQNPKRICSIVVMMNLQRSTLFSFGLLAVICPYYLVALSIGLSAIKYQARHTHRNSIGFTNTHIVSGLSRKKEGY